VSATLYRNHLKLYVLALHKVSVLLAGNDQTAMVHENIGANLLTRCGGDETITSFTIKPLYSTCSA
jgi:hypothetical protein